MRKQTYWLKNVAYIPGSFWPRDSSHKTCFSVKGCQYCVYNRVFFYLAHAKVRIHKIPMKSSVSCKQQQWTQFLFHSRWPIQDRVLPHRCWWHPQVLMTPTAVVVDKSSWLLAYISSRTYRNRDRRKELKIHIWNLRNVFFQ